MTKVLDSLGGGGKDSKNAANLNASTVIVVAGIAKVFVGELIEEGRAVVRSLVGSNPLVLMDLAKSVQEEWKDPSNGALMPSHILEAMRRLKQRNATLPPPSYRRPRSLL